MKIRKSTDIFGFNFICLELLKLVVEEVESFVLDSSRFVTHERLDDIQERICWQEIIYLERAKIRKKSKLK